MRSAARRRDDDDPGPPPDPHAEAARLRTEAESLAARREAIIDTLALDPRNDRAVDELVIAGIRSAENTAALEAVTAALRDAAAEGYILETALARGIAIGEARAAERMAAARRRRRGAHANPSQEGLFPRPRLVPGIALAAAALKPLSAAVRHSWPAQHLAQAGAIAGTVATLATAAVVVPHAALTSPFGAGTSAAPAPAASIYSATPVITPSSLPVISAFTRPKANPDAAASRPLTLPPPPAVSPAQGPGDQQAQGQLPAPAQQGPAPAVTLVVSHSLDLGTGSSGAIRITAYGGQVSWSVSSAVAGLSLDTASGTLAAGESAQIGVSLTAGLQALAGPADVVISYGDGKSVDVPVSWTVIPLPVVPDPVPSVVASIVPSVIGA